METLATGVQWGTAPKMYFDFSYDKKRDGSTQYYKIAVSLKPLTGSSYFGYPVYLEIKVAGETTVTKTLKDPTPSRWSSDITYTTDWIAVVNKTKGTTALTIRAYSGMGTTPRDVSYNYTLAINPAASLIGATDANIESASTISITKYDSSFTTTVSYKAAGQSSYTDIWAKQNHSSYAWTIPSSFYRLIPKNKEISVELRCQTYSGSTLIGTEYCTFTATTNQAKCAPGVSVVSAVVNAESTALTGNNKKIISGISNLQIITTATAKNSATISSITAYCGGKNLTGASVTFNGADSATVYVVVTDSRGYSTRVDDKSLTLINYVAPTMTPTITRDTPTGDTVTVYVKGSWYNGSFGSVANSLRISIRRKVTGEKDYHTLVEIPITFNGNEYTGSVVLSGIDYRKAYSFLLRWDDAIYTDANGYRDALYATVSLSKGIPVFDWGEDDFNFNVPVTINGVNILEKLAELEALLAAKG